MGDRVDFLLADKLSCLSGSKNQLHPPRVSQDTAKICKLLILGTLGFDKLIVSLWVCVARHAQGTQNNKFAISLQHNKKNMKDEVDFKHQMFLQVDTIIFGVCGQAYPNYPK